MELIDRKHKSERRPSLTKVEEIEKELDSKLAELRRSQDSLRKAIDAREKVLQTLDDNRSDTSSNISSGLEDENSDAESVASGDED